MPLVGNGRQTLIMLETPRLRLIPLTLGQLELALNDLPALAREMGMPSRPTCWTRTSSARWA